MQQQLCFCLAGFIRRRLRTLSYVRVASSFLPARCMHASVAPFRACRVFLDFSTLAENEAVWPTSWPGMISQHPSSTSPCHLASHHLASSTLTKSKGRSLSHIVSSLIVVQGDLPNKHVHPGRRSRHVSWCCRVKL